MNVEQIFGQPVPLPLRRALQRFRWFTASFTTEIAAQSAATGMVFETSDQAMARVFLDWRRAFVAQNPQDPSERERFIGFAAGLMLRSMIRHAPIVCPSAHGKNDLSAPQDFWPEGYAYVSYCLSMRAAILAEERGETALAAPERPPEWDDIRTWQSFRENVAQDPSLAIPFLDLFAGETPNWAARDVFSMGARATILDFAAHPH